MDSRVQEPIHLNSYLLIFSKVAPLFFESFKILRCSGVVQAVSLVGVMKFLGELKILFFTSSLKNITGMRVEINHVDTFHVKLEIEQFLGQPSAS